MLKRLIFVSLMLILGISIVNGGFSNNVPPSIAGQGYENTEIYRSGALDVTWYNVDNTGSRDSTAAIQQAINDAHDYNFFLYFPSGTYLISKTLELRKDGNVKNGHCSAPLNTNILIGDPDNRPLIKLKDNSFGFTNKGSTAPVIHFWAKTYETGNNCYYSGTYTDIDGVTHRVIDGNQFNQMIKNFDIDLGEGNYGAIGIDFRGAQGSSIENVKILARDSHAGLTDIPSSSGASVNVEVIGGDYGLKIEWASTGYVYGVRLIDQKVAAIRVDDHGSPQTIAGFYIEKDSGPIFENNQGQYFYISAGGTTGFVDGEIVLRNGGTVFNNRAGRGMYINNVYVKGADTLINSQGETQNSKGTWSHIKEYNYVSKETRGNLIGETSWYKIWEKMDAWSIINGNGPNKNTYVDISAASEPSQDFVSMHTFGREPFFLDSDVVNAVVDLGIDNVGKSDVSDQLQNAINSHEKVFLPRGEYHIGKTLTLGENTQLFGHDLAYVQIFTHSNWKPTSEVPVITTVNDKDATTYLSELTVNYNVVNLQNSYFTTIDWRAGRNSVLKKVAGVTYPWIDYTISENKDGQGVTLFKYSGNGGGKTFGVFNLDPTRTRHPNFRGYRVVGTTEPLTFYGFNPEHYYTGPYLDISNSENVRVLGVKTECTKQFAKISNSRNIMIMNHGIGCSTDDIVNLVINSEDVTLANHNFQLLGSGKMLREEYYGEINEIEGESVLSLFKRGNYDNTKFDHGEGTPGSSDCGLLNPPNSIPFGYGAPYDLDTSKMFFKSLCTDNSIIVNVGSSDITYIYENGYYWDGNNWEQFKLNGNNVDGSPWISGSANARISIIDLSENNYILSYACKWTGSKWKCGCRDQSCSQSFWNLQIARN